MPLETGTYISDLVITNPASTDAKSDGDNHLRLIKSTVKATFPNVTGAVTKTHTQLNNALDKTGDTMTGTLNVGSGGDLLVTGSGGLGYGVGSGGTVTQTGTRGTGVALNKPSGAIELVSAAGTSAWTTFVVTNSTVAVGDLVVLSVKNSSNVYIAHAINVAAGNFTIAFAAVVGTVTDAPVINFAVIKGATS